MFTLKFAHKNQNKNKTKKKKKKINWPNTNFSVKVQLSGASSPDSNSNNIILPSIGAISSHMNGIWIVVPLEFKHKHT